MVDDVPPRREPSPQLDADAEHHLYISCGAVDAVEFVVGRGAPVSLVDGDIGDTPAREAYAVAQSPHELVVGIGVVEEIIRGSYLEIWRDSCLERIVLVGGGVVAVADSGHEQGHIAVVHVQFDPYVPEAVFLAEYTHQRIPEVDSGRCLVDEGVLHGRRALDERRVDKLTARHGVDGDCVALRVSGGDQARAVDRLLLDRGLDLTGLAGHHGGDATLGRGAYRDRHEQHHDEGAERCDMAIAVCHRLALMCGNICAPSRARHWLWSSRAAPPSR